MSDRPEVCANCRTERYDVCRRGYCHRCYALVLQKEQVERWDISDPSTLKRFPSFAYQCPSEFLRIKADKIRELELRLEILQSNEERRSGKVSGLDIEHALKRTAKYSGGKEDAIGSIASVIT